jgi:hypothetical protein
VVRSSSGSSLEINDLRPTNDTKDLIKKRGLTHNNNLIGGAKQLN